MKKILIKIYKFYYDGFKNMTWGKKLWLIIIIKLFIMFLVLKLFFFKDFLNIKFETNAQKGDFVLKELTE